jgi:predicted aspartyl protease
MQTSIFIPFVLMLVLPDASRRENPWREKVPAAVERAEQAASPAAYAEALDIVWRADDWKAGLKLARSARQRFPDDGELLGPAARALWRAGQVEEAERVAAAIKHGTDNRIALTELIRIASAGGRRAEAEQLADRLERLGPQSAAEMNAILGPRLRSGRTRNMAELARKLVPMVRDENGYPDIYLKDSIDGIADFLGAVGDEPLNQIARFGAADMPLIQLLHLPGVEGTINGKGPYRFIVDTGGSITLSLDTEVASELELKSVAKATVRGVSGKQDSGQAVIGELQVGNIRMKRVMTRIWDFPPPMKVSIAGIIGTGMFDGGRMMLDFAGAKLVVSESSDRASAGAEVPLRIVGDGKLITLIQIAGQPGAALIDSGAGTTAISPARIAELFPEKKPRRFRAPVVGAGDDGRTSMVLAPGVDVAMFGKHYPAMPLIGLNVLDEALSPILGIQIDLLSGVMQMREMKSMTVDFTRSRMWVDWLDK